MTKITLHSPAKLNLFLQITGQRADGYHELQTIFQLIDAHDIMTFETNDTGHITLDISSTEILTVKVEDNLIYQAARLLKLNHLPADTASQKSHGCHIQLTKNLPTGGGIGGGSSNAATTLLALNQLWGIKLPLDQLAQLGSQLGADVPVFIEGFVQRGSAWAEGIGEQLTPCDTSSILDPSQYIVLLKPNVHASTAKLFQHSKLDRQSKKVYLADVLARPEDYGNAFEPVVTDLYPPVAEALDYLKEYQQHHQCSPSLAHTHTVPPRLTGSGACVFAVFDSEEKANQCLDQAPCDGLICQPQLTSQLHEQLGYHVGC